MILSVIIPTYNRVNLLRYTLDSLQPAHHPGVNIETIVVDDGSTDGTEQMIQVEYPLIRFLKNEGKGAPAARNTGLRGAIGEYVHYLDSDDIIGVGYFKKKLELLQQNPALDACYGEYEFFKSDGAFREEDIIFKHKYPQFTGPDSAKRHLIENLEGNYIPPLALVWRKELLLKMNGHDESLSINQDVDLLIRALFNGAKIVALQDGSKVFVRSHSLDTRVGDVGGKNEKWVQMLDLRKKIFKDLAVHHFNDPECRQALSRFLFKRWRLLRHSNKAVAAAYLAFAKEVYWPVKLKGDGLYNILSAIAGPVGAVKLKYFLLKRD